MLDIDFLPPEYHQRRTQRHAKPWRHVIVVVTLLVVAALASAQRLQRNRVQTELAVVAPLYDKLLADQKRLSDLKTRLSAVRRNAALLTYLRHPWPRTRLLATLLDPLPDGVRLEQCVVAREAVPPPTEIGESARPRASSEQNDASKIAGAERDLNRLREEYDKTRTVIRFHGSADNAELLHAYIGQLTKKPLFVRAELESLETVGTGEKALVRFRGVVVVRPGYGQPGARASAEAPMPASDARADRTTFAPPHVTLAEHRPPDPAAPQPHRISAD